jgi:hypothetical protein
MIKATIMYQEQDRSSSFFLQTPSSLSITDQASLFVRPNRFHCLNIHVTVSVFHQSSQPHEDSLLITQLSNICSDEFHRLRVVEEREAMNRECSSFFVVCRYSSCCVYRSSPSCFSQFRLRIDVAFRRRTFATLMRTRPGVAVV